MPVSKQEKYPEAVEPKCPYWPLLRGQKAVVTGSSTGIGAAIAEALGKAGADVLVNYLRDEGPAEEVAARVRQCGSKAVTHKADVSREDDVRGMFDRMREEFGGVDILVNNAGIQKDAPFDELSLEDWNKVIGVNLTGYFLCMREAVREFKKRGVRREVSCAAGKIICISSVHEVIPWAGHVNYAASKGGVMLLMKSVAQEVAPYRIRVNSIAPGAIRTAINQRAWEAPEDYQNLMKLIPYKRIGTAEEIGRAAAWLASDESDYVHGVTLFIDGGMTLYPGFETGG